MSADLAKYIDHTLLDAKATDADIERLCDEARRFRFASVCVNSRFVPLAVRLLRGSGVRTVSVVGFPLGAMATAAKSFEAQQAVLEGAEEIDMVLPIGALRQGDLEAVTEDIRAIVQATDPVPVKVILETALLTDDEKIAACAAAKTAGAAFVKTSTGFGPGGATEADVALLRREVGDAMGVKASGGIRTAEAARRMLAVGANRLGCSASVAIVGGAEAAGGGY